MRENFVKHDDELEKLLDEIPQATSHNFQNRNHHVYGGGGGGDRRSYIRDAIYGMYGMYDDDSLTQMKYPNASAFSSPVSGLSLPSYGSSSSLHSFGYPLSENGSPTVQSNVSSGNCNYPKSFWYDSKIPDLSFRKKDNGSMVDEQGLCDNLRRMCIRNQQENYCSFKDASMGGTNGLHFCDCLDGKNPIRGHNKHGGYNNFSREAYARSSLSSDFETNSAFSGFSQDSGLSEDYKFAKLFGSQLCSRRPETMHSQFSDLNGGMDSSRLRRQMMNDYWYRRNLATEQTASLNAYPMADTSHYAPQNGVNLMQERSMSRLPYYVSQSNSRPHLSAQNLLHGNGPLPGARSMPFSNARIPRAGLDAITSEGSFILQGEGLNYINSSRGFGRHASGRNGLNMHQRRPGLDIGHQASGAYEIPYNNDGIDNAPSSVYEYNSIAEAQGYIYLLAKDQLGCRFLQRKFDEGKPEDVQVIFNEIIDHVVELMVNPFGNYLMQKLLEVCTPEQKTQIILKLTEEPGRLVRISLNTHGTRVVQKLIETLKNSQQISLVISALEPGFLALIKDLNGNHVVHRCLQFLSMEDNSFIFAAATNYCVDIATHQHGCCVLQRCIGHSEGEPRERLIAEICSNALLLSQNQYGNYVVQFVLELFDPSATARIIAQFEGNYVQLSMEKFSSHVVEKCLAVFDNENRSRVICELLTAPHFEQLIQDPHANYVIQSALRLSEGDVHNLLVDAIESRKAISRNSPYSKKIFSQRLLRK